MLLKELVVCITLGSGVVVGDVNGAKLVADTDPFRVNLLEIVKSDQICYGSRSLYLDFLLT
jgi:hypothetical protein